jgi:hypothetical protein
MEYYITFPYSSYTFCSSSSQASCGLGVGHIKSFTHCFHESSPYYQDLTLLPHLMRKNLTSLIGPFADHKSLLEA